MDLSDFEDKMSDSETRKLYCQTVHTVLNRKKSSVNFVALLNSF